MTGLVSASSAAAPARGRADAFGVEQAPVSCVADLGQCGEVSQLFPDLEVARWLIVVSYERPPFHSVLLD